MAIGTTQANAILGALPATAYVQVHSGDPGADGTLNVIAGATRGLASLASAAGGARSASGSSECSGVPAGASVSHVSYWSALSGGTFHFSEPLAASVSFPYSGTLRLVSQTFSVTTTSSGSQTVTSVTSDTTAASESNVSRLFVKQTDTTSQSDAAAARFVSGATDTTLAAETVVLRHGVAVIDTTGQTDAANGNVGGVTIPTATTDTSSVAESNTAESVDGTAPSISAFTVPSSDTDTSITGISASATDNVAATAWLIVDVAGGASAPVFGVDVLLAQITQTTGISGGALSSSALTHTVGGTGARDCYLFVRDAAGNVTRSSVSTVTVNAGAGADQYAQASLSPPDGGQAIIWVRKSGSGATLTGYFYSVTSTDDGEGGYTVSQSVYKVVNGSYTPIQGSAPWSQYVRLEVSGTTLTLKGDNDGFPVTAVLGTWTDSDVSTGDPAWTGSGVSNFSSGNL